MTFPKATATYITHMELLCLRLRLIASLVTTRYKIRLQELYLNYIIFFYELIYQQVIRTDIVFDVGDSINPAVDVGQIEGGFIQGYGLWTLEDIEFGPEGQIRTLGPSNYKIPSSRDIPEVFNVALLKGAPNPHAIYSSKVSY